MNDEQKKEFEEWIEYVKYFNPNMLVIDFEESVKLTNKFIDQTKQEERERIMKDLWQINSDIKMKYFEKDWEEYILDFSKKLVDYSNKLYEELKTNLLIK